jgi:hypothetical protein
MSKNIGGTSSLKHVAERNDLGLTRIYKEIRAGRLIARKVGRRTVITAEDERNWRNALPRLSLGAVEAP